MSHHHSVSIVDDDAAVRDSMRILLEEHGLQVSDYASAELYLRHPPENCILIADIGMAVISGLELVEILREASIGTPAIILSDVMEPRLMPRIAAAAPCVQMTKPVKPAELLKTIKTSCGRLRLLTA